MTTSRQPKYQRLQTQLAALIHDGTIRPGGKLPTERALMAQYEVSLATVSRAIKELERQGLVQRRWGSGTYVKQTQATRTLAVTFDNCYQVNHPFMRPMLQGIEQEARRLGWQLQLFPVSKHRLFDGGPLEQMINEGMIHGVIGCSPILVKEIEKLTAVNLPFVSIYHAHQGPGVSHVMFDMDHVTTTVLDHLAGLGHESIALIVGQESAVSDPVPSASHLLEQHWTAQLQKRELPAPREHIIHSDYRFKSIEYTMRGILASHAGPTALVFIEDNLAIQTIVTANAMGLQVPQDISIVSMGDILEDAHLTCYRLELEDFGIAAVQMLDELTQEANVAPRNIQGKLLTRQSTASPRSGNQRLPNTPVHF